MEQEESKLDEENVNTNQTPPKEEEEPHLESVDNNGYEYYSDGSTR